MINKNYKFRGGLSVGITGTTWPNGILEISNDLLILRNEALKKEYVFRKDEITKIDAKMFFPFFANGIYIYHLNVKYDKDIKFWVFSLRKLTNALTDLGWLKN